jgi:hypothetical protein
MDTTAENYRLNEAKQQARLEQFKRSAGLATLENEIALARTLLEANQGNVLLVRDLLGVIVALVKTHRQQRERDGELLERSAVEKLGEEMITILAEELGGFDGECIDRIANRIAIAISSARNEPK